MNETLTTKPHEQKVCPLAGSITRHTAPMAGIPARRPFLGRFQVIPRIPSVLLLIRFDQTRSTPVQLRTTAPSSPLRAADPGSPFPLQPLAPRPSLVSLPPHCSSSLKAEGVNGGGGQMFYSQPWKKLPGCPAQTPLLPPTPFAGGASGHPFLPQGPQLRRRRRRRSRGGREGGRKKKSPPELYFITGSSRLVATLGANVSAVKS